MLPALSLEKMTTKDKLMILEQLWDDLTRNPEDVPSPTWHGEILSAREEEIKEGKAGFTDLAKAKNQIRKACR
ncbi:MAG: addiction module protein [Desulfobulbaceae bacterium]